VSVNISSSASPSLFGQNVTYTITVTPEVGAGAVPLVPVDIQFTSGPTPLPGVFSTTLVSGPTSLAGQTTYNPFTNSSGYVLQVTAPGNPYQLTVTFPQTTDFNSGSGTFTQFVNKANT